MAARCRRRPRPRGDAPWGGPPRTPGAGARQSATASRGRLHQVTSLSPHLGPSPACRRGRAPSRRHEPFPHGVRWRSQGREVESDSRIARAISSAPGEERGLFQRQPVEPAGAVDGAHGARPVDVLGTRSRRRPGPAMIGQASRSRASASRSLSPGGRQQRPDSDRLSHGALPGSEARSRPFPRRRMSAADDGGRGERDEPGEKHDDRQDEHGGLQRLAAVGDEADDGRRQAPPPPG